MAVLVFAEHHHGKFPKSSLEAVSYGSALAGKLNTSCIALTHGPIEGDGGLGTAGASRVLVYDGSIKSDSQQLTRIALDAAAKTQSDVIVFSHDDLGRMVAPRVAARLGAGIVPSANALPETSSGFVVRKSVFSGKAFAHVAVETTQKVVTV